MAAWSIPRRLWNSSIAMTGPLLGRGRPITWTRARFHLIGGSRARPLDSRAPGPRPVPVEPDVLWTDVQGDARRLVRSARPRRGRAHGGRGPATRTRPGRGPGAHACVRHQSSRRQTALRLGEQHLRSVEQRVFPHTDGAGVVAARAAWTIPWPAGASGYGMPAAATSIGFPARSSAARRRTTSRCRCATSSICRPPPASRSVPAWVDRPARPTMWRWAMATCWGRPSSFKGAPARSASLPCSSRRPPATVIATVSSDAKAAIARAAGRRT